jgi:hypothetical protein
MNENVKCLKYLVEVEAPYNNINNVDDSLNALPFVKNVTLVDSNVTFKDLFGKLKRGIDGLQYQYEQRGE